MGSRLQAQRRAQRVAWDEGDENEGQPAVPAQEEEGIEKPAEVHPTGKIGAKKLRKLEEKQARKAQREASKRLGHSSRGQERNQSLVPMTDDLWGSFYAELVFAVSLAWCPAVLAPVLAQAVAFFGLSRGWAN